MSFHSLVPRTTFASAIITTIRRISSRPLFEFTLLYIGGTNYSFAENRTIDTFYPSMQSNGKGYLAGGIGIKDESNPKYPLSPGNH